MSPSESTPPASRADLRLVAAGACAWGGTLWGLGLDGVWLAGLAVAGAGWCLRDRSAHRMAWVVVAIGFAVSAHWRAHLPGEGALPDLAAQRAVVSADVRLGGDPLLRTGERGPFAMARGTVLEVTGRGATHAARSPVLVLAPASWARSEAAYGAVVRIEGRLAPAESADLSGVLSARGPPRVLDAPAAPLGGLERIRSALRESVAHQPIGPRSLVPALVVGDDSGMPEQIAADFRTSGLTHLLAVSGTNLTLVVGALLLIARGLGVRARGLTVLGLAGVVFFVLLARPEPSVVRAAAMGTVALLGLGRAGPGRGVRALGAAVLVLLAVDPWLARSWGFALSASATGGILFLAPSWRDRMVRWMPRWAAEAVAVPLAAQLACTPLVAALSAQVSLVAVAANMLAAPLVAPATVLGLAGGLVGVVLPGLAVVPGTLAGWSAAGIIAIARWGAGLPTAAVDWRADGPGLVLLTVLCLLLAVVLPRVLSRAPATAATAVVLGVVVAVPAPTPGWPPPDWAIVACDVGQGDGLVLATGPGSAVVVDTGRDPAAIDGCLDRLGVTRVPLVVITHFHDDHSGGLAGVLEGRAVAGIQVTDLPVPITMAERTRAVAAQYDVPLRIGAPGEAARIGELRWRLLAPTGPPPADSESPSNDASLVMLARVRGVSILLTGDQEPASQARLRREHPGLRADVLKVAHHGSGRQDPELIRSLGARLALISVGVDNDYGHPHPDTMALLQSSGMSVRRTDRDGDIAVVVRAGEMRVVSLGR